MKTIIQSATAIGLILALTNCTAYVDPGVEDTHTTTTRTVSDNPYTPGATVTTRKTTTRY